jgi:hypothetical protein
MAERSYRPAPPFFQIWATAFISAQKSYVILCPHLPPGLERAELESQALTGLRDAEVLGRIASVPRQKCGPTPSVHHVLVVSRYRRYGAL